MLEFFLFAAAVILGVILAFMPWLIYDELKRQGKERRDEALKIISLMVGLTGGPRDKNADIAAGLQSVIDMKVATKNTGDSQ